MKRSRAIRKEITVLEKICKTSIEDTLVDLKKIRGQGNQTGIFRIFEERTKIVVLGQKDYFLRTKSISKSLHNTGITSESNNAANSSTQSIPNPEHYPWQYSSL